MNHSGDTRRAAFVYLLLAGLQRGTSLLILPFISHALSPGAYGAATTLTASALFLVTIVAAPLEQLVFRAVARGGAEEKPVIRAVGVYCYIVLPVFLIVVSAFTAIFLPPLLGIPGNVWAIELLAVAFLPAVTYFALPSVRARQALGKFTWLALGSVVTTALSKIALVVVWQLGVLGWAISDLVGAAVSAILGVALVRLPKAHVTLSTVKQVFSFAVPLIPHRASFWALSSLSRPTMAVVSTLVQVGLLAFGVSLATVANMILAEINQAVLPHYSREKFPAPTEETFGPVKWQLLCTVAIPALVGAGIALSAQWLFAEPYWKALPLTAILLVGQVAYGFYLIPMNYLVQTAGQPKFSGIASASGVAFIFVGILAFGRQFGAAGSAYATAVGFVVMTAVAMLLTRVVKLDIDWHRWSRAWPEISVSVIGFACSTVSLISPLGSTASHGFAGVCLILVAIAFTLAARPNPADETRAKN